MNLAGLSDIINKKQAEQIRDQLVKVNVNLTDRLLKATTMEELYRSQGAAQFMADMVIEFDNVIKKDG